jgi:hypothetical protein
MRARWIVLVSSLVATSAVLAQAANHWAADRIGSLLGGRLAAVLEHAEVRVAASPLRQAPRVASPAKVAEARSVPDAPAKQARVSSSSRSSADGSPAPRAEPPAVLLVRSARVLDLANRGARPTAAYAKGRAGRPAGLVLSGVGQLGIGLQDGDVLTHVGSVPVASTAQVTGLVLAARGREEKAMEARLWRAGHVIKLVVEQPYVQWAGSPLGEPERRDRARNPRRPARSGSTG